MARFQREALIPTRQQRIAELVDLLEDIRCLVKSYLRWNSVRSKYLGAEISETPPDGYATWLEYQMTGVVDRAFVPGEWQNYLYMRESLVTYLDQLRSSVARRGGDPVGHRRQKRDVWLAWDAGEPLPRLLSPPRELARRLLDEGRTFEETVHIVADSTMMREQTQLTKSRAESVKKQIDREFRAQYNEEPPKLPRGWWHKALDDMEPNPGGIEVMGLAWTPTFTSPQDTSPDFPFHFRAQMTIQRSCWLNDPDFY